MTGTGTTHTNTLIEAARWRSGLSPRVWPYHSCQVQIHATIL